MKRALLVWAVVQASAAWAGDWATAFQPGAVAPWLPLPPRPYLVASAGEGRPEGRAAGLALADALRRGGRATLVMTDEALGDLSASSDEQVLQRCAVLPVELVALLRVFPTTADGQPVAVVTLYDKAGTAQGSFSCTRGTPCAPPSGGLGLRTSSDRPVKPPPPPPPPPPVEVKVDPQDAYAARFLWFEGDPKGEKPEGDMGHVLRGTRKRPLEGSALYLALGRKDLAERYGARSLGKVAAGLGGLVAVVGGGALYWVSSTSPCVKAQYSHPNAEPDACLQRSWPDLTVPSIGLAAVGVGLVAFGLAFPSHPVDGAEAKALLDEHNRKLKTELGFTATLLPGGGAVAVGGQF